MTDFFYKHIHSRTAEPINREVDIEGSKHKKCVNPFAGWGGPLQIPAKILFTIGDFFGMLVAVAFIFHIIILVGTHGTTQDTKSRDENDNQTEFKIGEVVLSLFFMWIFGLSFANLAIIPIFVFTRFSYFKKNGGLFNPILRAIYSPLTVFESNKISQFIYGIFYLVYFVLFVIFILAAYLTDKQWGFNGFDRLLLGVVVVIPLARVLLIVFSYAVHAWISFFYAITCNRRRYKKLLKFKKNVELDDLSDQNLNNNEDKLNENKLNEDKLDNQLNENENQVNDELNQNDYDENKYKQFGRKFRRHLDKFKDESSYSDHGNMNTIKSTTFDGGFDSPFDYVPKFARSDPFLYSIYGQATLFSWHCTSDGRTNTWSAIWEIYHLLVTLSTTIYLIYSIAHSMDCTGNCLGCIFMFVLVLVPLTIRVRFPFFVLHSLFSCCPGIDQLFECFGKCKYNFGFYFLCKNSEISDDEVEKSESDSVESNYYSTQNEKKKYPNFELLALSSRGLGIMSAVVYLIIILVMLVITVFILSNYAANKRDYPNYSLDLDKFYQLKQINPNSINQNPNSINQNPNSINQINNQNNELNQNIKRKKILQIDKQLNNKNERIKTQNKLNKIEKSKGKKLNEFETTSQICNVKPYGLSMIQYFLLCDLSYSNISSPQAEVAINEFFPDVKITSKGQLDLKKYKMGSLSYFNFDSLDLTVVAIRGSTEGIDWALDIQFFLSSALLTISGPLNIFAKDDTSQTTNAIRSILAAPLRLMEQFTLFYDFYNDLDSYYENGIVFNKNIIFTGHSLGGGFAKLFGHAKGKAAISVSGPGITLFQSIVKGKKKNLYSIITEADVIPDSDIVPRVEKSAATTYRVLCNEGFGTCHAIKHTLCMTGIMCNTPHEAFCRSFNDSVVSEIYDEMVDYADLE